MSAAEAPHPSSAPPNTTARSHGERVRAPRGGIGPRAALLLSIAAHAAAFSIGYLIIHPVPPRTGVVDARENVGSLTTTDVESARDEAPAEREDEPAETPLRTAPALDLDSIDSSPDVDAAPPEPDAPVSDEPPSDPRNDPLPDEPTTLSPSALGVRMRPARVPSPAPPPRPPPVAPTAPPLAQRVSHPAGGEPSLHELEAPLPPLVSELAEGVTLVVRLEYTILADGRVADARVVGSSGDAQLDESTRAFVVARWRYVPPGADRRVVKRFRFVSGR